MIEEQRDRKRKSVGDRKMTRARPPYVPPVITTYDSEAITEQIGPARACSPSPCGIF